MERDQPLEGRLKAASPCAIVHVVVAGSGSSAQAR